MSTIKVNTIETRTGSTLTLGKSGDTVSIASGASTSGMGRTGTVDWQTAIKTESFTAVSGEGYFVDTADGTPFKNYTTTVATGTLYIVGGSGNVFNLDGSQQTSLSLLKGKTYRFTQSDSSNDGHQLIISTSNSTTLGTFQAGIVSSGITYYIDGSATQSNWLNTTTFNAGTTRYIEFKPSTTGTFYFGCYNHGIGMGGAITSADLTVTLPSSPSVGDIVAIKDYANNFDTNNLTINRNGSNISGSASNFVLSVEGQAITLVYGDATKGWQVVNAATESDLPPPKFVTATGGTETIVCTNFKVHTFTGPGTFNVTCAGNPQGSTSVDYLVIASGASGGGGSGAGGGGAGGYRESSGSASGCYTTSPLGACVSALPVSVQGYSVVVGAGGAAQTSSCKGNAGSVSTFSTITSAGGGGGGGENTPAKPGDSGGSGGGGQGNPSNISGGAGNTPPVSPPQGNNGGNGVTNYAGGGGGGATGVGGTGPNPAGAGGAGATSSINGSPTARAGGGGGGQQPPAGCGPGPATAGGGAGGVYHVQVGQDATANTGGGGGGNAFMPGTNTSGSGGSGIVIIRYRYQ